MELTTNGDMAILIGRAGTGKSYTLGAVHETCEVQGYRVRGLALSGIAAESLQNESGIQSKTIHRQLLDWEKGRDLPGRNEILVLDEAGMVGTRLMHEVISHAQEAGAKVILVGDNEQLQSIEAGGSFRGIIQKTGYIELSEIRRQQRGWQKEATKEFSGNKDLVAKALDAYKEHGNIMELGTKEQAKEQLLKDWAHYRTQHKQGTTLMLAYTNNDVEDLNIGARQQRKLAGELKGSEHALLAKRGERRFSAGDRIIFLRNESSLHVRSGALGTVEQIKDGTLAVELDNGERVAFDAAMYKDFDHGYAPTVHKTQGSTLDRTFVIGSRHFNKHTAYVAMSRHSEDVTLYYSKSEFKDFDDLKLVMGRDRPKGLIADYGLNRGIEVIDRFIQAERQRGMAERNEQVQEKAMGYAEDQYIKQMKQKDIHVVFPNERYVEGYFTRIEDIGGKKCAAIETNVDPTRGVRYMIPYHQEYDQMQRRRFVTYDGLKMNYSKTQSVSKGIELSKGLGIWKR